NERRDRHDLFPLFHNDDAELTFTRKGRCARLRPDELLHRGDGTMLKPAPGGAKGVEIFRAINNANATQRESAPLHGFSNANRRAIPENTTGTLWALRRFFS